jgi:hypothetical protein
MRVSSVFPYLSNILLSVEACGMRTAVGLARSANVDLRFFPPPAPLPPGVGSQTVVNLFREILTSLPADTGS